MPVSALFGRKDGFGRQSLASVRPSQVRAWTARLKAEGREASYAYALHSRLSQIMADAVHDGLISRNPCSRKTSPGAGKQRPCVITTEQIWQLHASTRPRHSRLSLRHYLASFLIAHGADVKLVQARLRHASAKTTLDTYGHLWPDRDKSTRTALEAVFEAGPEHSRNKAGAR